MKRNDLALIMKGGGVKGLAYVGALEELEKFYQFNWYAGTSAGAISAILLACGYTSNELQQILSEKDFSDFTRTSILKQFRNLITKGGLHDGDNFTKWLDFKLASKLDFPHEVRLDDLPCRTTVYASKRGHKGFIFDSEDPSVKHNRAAFAARCSMSIPFIFTPQKSQGENVLDGGVQNNFPVDILLRKNPNTNFIGLYLGSPIYEGVSSSGVFKDLLSIWTESVDQSVLRKHRENIIIIDPRPISSLDLKLTQQQKEFLLESGRLAARRFLVKKELLKINDKNLIIREEKLEIKRKNLNNQKNKRRIKKLFYFLIIVTSIIVVYCNFFLTKNEFFTKNVEKKSIKNLILLEECTPQKKKIAIRIANFNKKDTNRGIIPSLINKIKMESFREEVEVDGIGEFILGGRDADSIVYKYQQEECKGVPFSGFFIYGNHSIETNLFSVTIDLINVKDTIVLINKDRIDEIPLETPHNLKLDGKLDYVVRFIALLLKYYSYQKPYDIEGIQDSFLQIIKENPDNKRLNSYCNYYLGNISFLEKKYEVAQFFYKKSKLLVPRKISKYIDSILLSKSITITTPLIEKRVKNSNYLKNELTIDSIYCNQKIVFVEKWINRRPEINTYYSKYADVKIDLMSGMAIFTINFKYSGKGTDRKREISRMSIRSYFGLIKRIQFVTVNNKYISIACEVRAPAKSQDQIKIFIKEEIFRTIQTHEIASFHLKGTEGAFTWDIEEDKREEFKRKISCF